MSNQPKEPHVMSTTTDRLTEEARTTEPGWADYASDLRRLADLIEQHHADLPEPRHQWLGMGITVSTDSPGDVRQAAYALGSTLEGPGDTGHTVTEVVVGMVRLRFVNISAASMAEYTARQKYADTMPLP